MIIPIFNRFINLINIKKKILLVGHKMILGNITMDFFSF